MATAQSSTAPTVRRGVQPLRAGQGTSFIWRKLHSLLGIIPIGAFLLEHLLSNFEALKGPIAYGDQVKFLNSVCRWCGCWSGHLFLFPSCITLGTAFISGCAENRMLCTTRGRGTGCTLPSAIQD